MNILKFEREKEQDVLDQTSSVLKNGGLVVFPSDTVYGLLVDAKNEKAVSKLIQFKNRSPGKAISVFVENMQMLQEHVRVSSKQKNILHTLLPGPFTVVFPSKHSLSSKLESEKGALGVRIPDYFLVNRLVTLFASPVTATSANLGGRHPHHSISSFLKQIPESKKNLIDLIVDAGKLPRNAPSTVIDYSEPEMKILRKGDILLKDQHIFISNSPAQTIQLGEYTMTRIMNHATDYPIVIILKGDLGAGKTELTRGMARYFGITNIISPTFVIQYEYKIQQSIILNRKSTYKHFVHADLYNIQSVEELEHVGLFEYLEKPNIIVIEWGEKLGDYLSKFQEKAKVMIIEIEGKSEKVREIAL